MIDFYELKANLKNWLPLSEVANHFPQFTVYQIKRLFWQRHKYIGLDSCYRQIGKKGYVCLPLFGLWMAGALPEQNKNS